MSQAVSAMSIALFRRGMKWRAEVESRIEQRRLEIREAEGTPAMRFSDAGGASAADHVDSYWEYRRLVGESDGGTLLGAEEYAELRRLAAQAARKWQGPEYRYIVGRCRGMLFNEFPNSEWAKLAKSR